MAASTLLSTLLLLSQVSAQIPSYVNTYAPLVYLDQNERYLPSDIQAQLSNTVPRTNYSTLASVPSPLNLSNVNDLNALRNCTAFTRCDIYLTSNVDSTSNPPYLYGVLPASNGTTVGATSSAVIVNDHGDGTVDAFYMYFYAFNYGLNVSGQVLGNHVGDWEHSMIRFVNGIPSTIWYSAHDAGNVYTFDAVLKNGSRPIVYSAIGSHANYAVPGVHTRNIAGLLVNDYTSNGPIWDPTGNAYYYTYQPTTSGGSADYSASSQGPMTAINGAPTGYLDFFGRWGDQQYNSSDPRQLDFLGLHVAYRWGGGPTGPRDKVLQRNGTCPNTVCLTETALPATSGSSIPATVTRTGGGGGGGGGGAVVTTSVAGGGSTAVSTSPGAATSVRTGVSTAGASRARETGLAVAGMGLLAALF